MTEPLKERVEAKAKELFLTINSYFWEPQPDSIKNDCRKLAKAVMISEVKARIDELKILQSKWESWTNSPEYVLYQMITTRINELTAELNELERGE